MFLNSSFVSHKCLKAADNTAIAVTAIRTGAAILLIAAPTFENIPDSFVKILTSLDQFNYRGEGSLRAWIKSIVAHQAINHIKQYEHLKLTDQFPESMVQESEDPDVDRVPPDILNKLISELPAGYRIVLNLYVFEQKSHKEIAHLLGIKPETSASQFSRAKQALAKRINEYLNNSKL